MEDWQQRVVTEKAELDEKITKLSAFFNTPTFWDLPADERLLLEHQHNHMHNYSAVLGERIAAFKEGA